VRLVIIGPPGSGKGTRARIIGKLYNIPVITTGDMLRNAVAEDTKLGKLADSYMRKGELVRDDIVIGIVKEQLSKPNIIKGFVLDGFPRSVEQAEALDQMLREQGICIDVVLVVKAEPNTIINRLSLRRSCPTCGAVYHLKDMPPAKEGVCDECGTRLVQRNDDKEEIILNRLEVYWKQTFPILERYMNADIVREISGELNIDQIPDEVERILSDIVPS
jgi:adenylate kinase